MLILFNLADLLSRKQERESGRLADHEFRCRARTIGLVANWVRSRGASDFATKSCVERMVMEDTLVIIQDLRGETPDPPGDEDWKRLVAALSALAEAEIRIEHGDPTPFRMA